jgi:2-(1,2-epoxy-1,2-dihydrophenyl)acetyl-CoA isomerase
VGGQRARRFFFENDIWTGEQAFEYGAVDEVVSAEVLLDRAVEVAANWGRWAQVSRQATKQLLDAASTTFMETQLEFERVAITAASLTPDFAEGVSAFLEKREPNFSTAEEE